MLWRKCVNSKDRGSHIRGVLAFAIGLFSPVNCQYSFLLFAPNRAAHLSSSCRIDRRSRQHLDARTRSCLLSGRDLQLFGKMAIDKLATCG